MLSPALSEWRDQMTDAAIFSGNERRSVVHSLLFSRSFGGRPYLISPVVDTLMAGGGALIALAVFWVVLPTRLGISRENVASVAAVFAAVSYVVNYPHFMASYGLLYGNLGERMAGHSPRDLTWWRYAAAAYIVPIALVLFFIGVFLTRRIDLIGLSVQVMFFFVGWHYVKQAYGVFVVLSGMKGIIYTRWQVLALKLHVYSLWLYTWYISGAVVLEGMSPQPMNFHNIRYDGLSLFKSKALIDGLFWPVVALAVAGWAAILWHWAETKKRPSISGLAGYTSMYTLLAFVSIHPLFAYAAPALHSAQYLLFVYAYKRGEFHVGGEAAHMIGDPAKARPPWYRMLSYFLLICATGALFFDILPLYFEAKGPRWGWGWPLLATPIFHVFINVHHYFIDTAIWRRDNRSLGRYLFWRPDKA